jgi:hypothetical protein
VGRLVTHSRGVVAFSNDEFDALKYHGWIAGEHWPEEFDFVRSDIQGKARPAVEEEMKQLSARLQPEFFVVLNPELLGQKPDLAGYLASHFRLIRETAQYAVFDMRADERGVGPTARASEQGG